MGTTTVTGKRGKAHHAGTYATDARLVRAQAWADPATRCWRCHLTHAEYATLHGDRAARWTAGHVVDGQVGGELKPEHARCNYSAGTRLLNAIQRGRPRTRNQHTRTW